MAKDSDREEEPLYPPPERRMSFSGHAAEEARLRRLLDDGALSSGWMIAGPDGLGKATLSYRIARAYLDPDSLGPGETLNGAESKTSHLVAQKAHPDLFIAERLYDEKKDRHATEITVDTIRAMIAFMSRTSGSGRRVAIVDSADDLNRNAANALLKVLEEPPRNSLLLLTTNAPGRLLPTIRSRCRVLQLKPLSDIEIAEFLSAENAATPETRGEIAAAAGGRPGFALKLAAGEGADALDCSDAFLTAVMTGRGLSAVADRLAPRSADDLWNSFKAILLRQLASAATALATGDAVPPRLERLATISPDRIAAAWEKIGTLIAKGEALNTNRAQIVIGMGLAMRETMKGSR